MKIPPACPLKPANEKTARTDGHRRRLVTLFGLLILACAATVVISGCDGASQARYMHWQTSADLAELPGDYPVPDDSESLIDEWLYTGDGFEGTFIQPNEGHCLWSDKQWAAEMANLRHIGFDTIIIQWSELNNETFLGIDGDGKSLVDRIVAEAQNVGIDVYVGLSLRESWWDSRNVTMGFMRTELARNKRIARQLYSRLKQYTAFRGWYIPHEVSDLYSSAEQKLLILTFYKQLTAFLNEMDPLKTVMASGYTNHDASSLRNFTKWYSMFLADSGIDIFVFQDGAGLSGRTEWKNILPYADALTTISKKEFKGDVWLLAEVFTQTAGPPVNNRQFSARPAEFARVREQLNALGLIGTKIVIYSYFEYMRPSAGKDETKLYEAYHHYITAKMARIAHR